MKKKGVIFSIFGMVVLLGGIAAGALLVKRNQDFRERAAPATVLRLATTSSSVAPGDSFNIDVLMDTGENSVTGVDIIVEFDANNFAVTSVQKGNGITGFTNEIRNTYDNVGGTVTYSAFTLDSLSAVTGSGIAVLRVGFASKGTSSTGSYPFDFGAATAVAGTGEGQNVLIDTIPVSVTITGGGTGGGDLLSDTPTPTPTATATPTTGGVPTGTATSTPTATATASPGVGGAGLPTKTPTPTPTTSSATPFPIPESGIGGVTIFGIGLGTLALFFSLSLAF